jgi:fumarate hydratase subunit beta
MGKEIIKITTPLDRKIISGLKAGDMVTFSGETLVFRDQVHKILCGMIEKEQELPFSLENAALYYCGPTPEKSGIPAGSAGPTTSGRMDKFTEPLLKSGLAMTIGKGDRSPEIDELMKKYSAVYMLACGGAGAYIGKCVKSVSVIGFNELGPEAARIFVFENLPLLVGIDTRGNEIFKK